MAGRAEGHSQRFYGGQFDNRVIGEEAFVNKVLPKAPEPARARAVVAWLALKSGAATLTDVANLFNRDVPTLSHAVTALEQRSRNSESFANALNQHRYAICQA